MTVDWNGVSDAIRDLEDAVYLNLSEKDAFKVEGHIEHLAAAASLHDAGACLEAAGNRSDFAYSRLDWDAVKPIVRALDDVLAAID